MISYYEPDIRTAQDYYPFGMLMPGRKGFASGTVWVVEGSGSSLPASVSYNTRTGNTPLEYKATNSIEFTEGFESGVGDEFVAYITTDGGSGGSSGIEGREGIYRYGFNGKENDNEIKGEGNQQDYGMRIYDPRLGKFLSTDPLAKEYTWYTPYQFAGNKPIGAIDLDGGEEKWVNFSENKMAYPSWKGNLWNKINAGSGYLMTGVWNGAMNTLDAIANPHVTLGGIANETDATFNLVAHGTTRDWKRSAKQFFNSPDTYENLAFGLFTYGVGRFSGSAAASTALKPSSINPATTAAAEAGETISFKINAPKFSLKGSSVYRFDTRSLDQITEAGGFNSWGIEMDILEHANGNNVFNKSTGYVSTSFSLSAVKKFAGNKKGFIYTIEKPSIGINVNKKLGKQSPFPKEKEYAVPLNIPASKIKSVKKTGG